MLKENQLSVVAEINLEGVSGSMPGNRNDINEIVERKITRNDFTYLILPCADRFTRAGALHGQAMLWELAINGIVVYFVQEAIFSDNDLGRTYLGFLFDAARQQAKQISKGSTEGQTYSFLDGKSPHTRCIPYGCDRVYTVGDKPMHIMRNLLDKTQEQWTPEEDPADRTLIQTFAENVNRGLQNHYKKQRNENVSLIPGDPNHRKVVERIMRDTWLTPVGLRKIARGLNNDGIPAPGGGLWAINTVYQMARQPIYIGIGVRGRVRQGIYHHSSTTGTPIEANRTVQDIAKRQKVPQIRRPRSEWIIRECTGMATYLSPEVREAATIGIKNHLDRLASAPVALRGAEWIHKESQYLLSGILYTTCGLRMTGVGGRKPAYSTILAREYPLDEHRKTHVTRVARAEPLHVAVLGVLKSVMTSRPNLEAAVQRVLDSKKTLVNNFDTEGANKRLKALRARQIFLSRRLTGEADHDAVVHREIEDVDRQIESLDSAINESATAKVIQPSASVLVKQFMDAAADLDNMDRKTLKALLRSVINKIEFNLATRGLEMELSLPSWYVLPSAKKVGVGGAVPSHAIRNLARYSAPKYRPKLLVFSLTHHGEGPTEHYTRVRVDDDGASDQIKLAS